MLAVTFLLTLIIGIGQCRKQIEKKNETSEGGFEDGFGQKNKCWPRAAANHTDGGFKKGTVINVGVGVAATKVEHQVGLDAW